MFYLLINEHRIPENDNRRGRAHVYTPLPAYMSQVPRDHEPNSTKPRISRIHHALYAVAPLVDKPVSPDPFSGVWQGRQTPLFWLDLLAQAGAPASMAASESPLSLSHSLSLSLSFFLSPLSLSLSRGFSLSFSLELAVFFLLLFILFNSISPCMTFL